MYQQGKQTFTEFGQRMSQHFLRSYQPQSPYGGDYPGQGQLAASNPAFEGNLSDFSSRAPLPPTKPFPQTPVQKTFLSSPGGVIVVIGIFIVIVIGAATGAALVARANAALRKAALNDSENFSFAPTIGATFGPTVLGGTRAPTKAPVVQPSPEDRFDIQLVFLNNLRPEEQAAFQDAKARWEEVINADFAATATVRAGQSICGLPAGSTDLRIDDLLIFAEVSAIDGDGKILGQAGPCAIANGQVRAGRMTFDSADTAAMIRQGTLKSVILHEMGHVLGLGTLWDNIISPPSVTTNIRYLASQGNVGHVEIGGQGQAFVEDLGGQGTARGHWKESVYQNELMTGFISGNSQPMSRMTIRALSDLGYSVDPTKADGFVVPSAQTGRRLRTAIQEDGVRMENDLYSGPVTEIDNVIAKKGREKEHEAHLKAYQDARRRRMGIEDPN